MAGRCYVFYYPGLSEDTCIEAIGDILLSLLSYTPFYYHLLAISRHPLQKMRQWLLRIHTTYFVALHRPLSFQCLLDHLCILYCPEPDLGTG